MSYAQQLRDAMEHKTYNGRKVPEHIRDGIVRYIVDQKPPGSFLRAVIQNDLKSAVAHADEMCRSNLHATVMFFVNDAPSRCWGNRINYDDWIEKRRRA